ETTTGILFDFSPPDLKGKFVVTVGQNYFGKTASVLRSGGPGGSVPGVTVTDNGFGSQSGVGNFPSPGVIATQGPDLPTSADDEPTFLRFPGELPTVGPNKVAVGARP